MTQSVAASIFEDDRYDEFLLSVQDSFNESIRGGARLFTTDASDLWEEYLHQAPRDARQSRTCHCCKAFIEKFGGLVTISPTGALISAIWSNPAPHAFVDARRWLASIVEHSSVTGVFRSSEATWGTPQTGPWTHISVVPPKSILWTSVVSTAEQEMAAKREEFKMLKRSLAEFDRTTVLEAVTLLSTDALYRSEKYLGIAQWLLDLHDALAGTKHRRVADHLVWRAVANAPTGYCHVRSSMIGTLLEDIAAKLPFTAVKRKFAEKMNPLQYMRPTATPAAGNIAQAEKIVGALKSAGALERRFAKLSDIQSIWPTPLNDSAAARSEPHRSARIAGVFGHLTKAPAAAISTVKSPPTVMTWVKFLATILPTAEEIEFLVPIERQSYTAMVTAKNPDAPNLLQWDNTVSHYVYSSGSTAGQWNLTVGQHRRVTAVSLRSWMWGATPSEHHGAGVVFVLEDARDTTYICGAGMFPEQMRSEYHPVRKTLEAHFRTAVVEGKNEATACGLALVKGQSVSWNATFRVTSRGIRTSYKLDRWD